MLHDLIGLVMDVICCRYHIGSYKEKEFSPLPRQQTPVTLDISPSSSMLTDLTDAADASLTDSQTPVLLPQ